MDSSDHISISSKVCDYIKGFQKSSPVLDRLHDESCSRRDVVPHIGPHAGTLLAWLVRLTGARKALEFGTCIGYSTIALGEAIRLNRGNLVSIELSKTYYEETLKNVREAGLEEFVTLINGDAETVIDELEGPFDFILQDSAKSLYPKMLEKCVSRIRKGGIIAADDTLFTPLGMQEKISRHMDRYNELVFSHSELDSIILPVGDGLTLSYKK